MKLIFKESIYFSTVQILGKNYCVCGLEKKLETLGGRCLEFTVVCLADFENSSI